MDGSVTNYFSLEKSFKREQASNLCLTSTY
jgi:hypothetical protein